MLILCIVNELIPLLAFLHGADHFADASSSVLGGLAEACSAAASKASIRLSIPSSCFSSAEAVCSPLENVNTNEGFDQRLHELTLLFPGMPSRYNVQGQFHSMPMAGWVKIRIRDSWTYLSHFRSHLFGISQTLIITILLPARHVD